MRTRELTEDLRAALDEFFGSDPTVEMPPSPSQAMYSAGEWGLGPGSDGAQELNQKLYDALLFVHQHVGLMTAGNLVVSTQRLVTHANDMIRKAWFKKLRAPVAKLGASPDFALAKLLDFARDITGMKNMPLQGSWLRQL